MATSTCPKCSGTSFELAQYTPRNADFKYNFIQCSSCGCVVGVQEFYNIGASLFEGAHSLDIRFNKVHSLMSDVQSRVSALNDSIQNLSRKLK